LPEHPELGFGKAIDVRSNVDFFLLGFCKGSISSSGNGGQFAYFLTFGLSLLAKTDFLSLQSVELLGREISVIFRVVSFRTSRTFGITLQYKIE
jgi:hypothetical protein